MIKVGIVIPFYGGNIYINKLLSSIEFYDLRYEIFIVIVDNSVSSERLNQKLIEDFKVEVISTKAGIGFAKACNIGFRKCIDLKCEVLFILNQDGYFKKNSFLLILDNLIQDKDYTAAVPLLQKYNSDQVEWFFTYVYLTKLEDLVSDLFNGKLKKKYTINQLCGACFALKLRDYYNFDYLFDEIFHLYFEDEDLYKRMLMLEQKIMILPNAVFHHNHSNTSNWDTELISIKIHRRVSKLSFDLKYSNKNFFNSLLGSVYLEIRTILLYILSFQFRSVLIEILAFLKFVFLIPKIYNRRLHFNRRIA